jgi:hypothetical protein
MKLRPIPIKIDEEDDVIFEISIRNPFPNRKNTFIWEALINKLPVEGNRPFATIGEAFADAQSTLFEE